MAREKANGNAKNGKRDHRRTWLRAWQDCGLHRNGLRKPCARFRREDRQRVSVTRQASRQLSRNRDLAAHIHLEMRLLTALAAARDTDPSV